MKPPASTGGSTSPCTHYAGQTQEAPKQTPLLSVYFVVVARMTVDGAKDAAANLNIEVS